MRLVRRVGLAATLTVVMSPSRYDADHLTLAETCADLGDILNRAAALCRQRLIETLIASQAADEAGDTPRAEMLARQAEQLNRILEDLT